MKHSPPPSFCILCCKLQRFIHKDFFLPADCSGSSTPVFVKLQIAASNLQPCFSCCNLQQQIHSRYFLPAICFSPFFCHPVFSHADLLPHRSSVLSLPGESNSRSRTIVAALPSGVSPPSRSLADQMIHARSVTLCV